MFRRSFARRALVDFINPKSITIVGNVGSSSTIASSLARNIRASKFQGPLYVVDRTPAHHEHPPAPHCTMAADIKQTPKADMVVLVVPAKQCLAVVNDAIAAGSRQFVIVSAGFAEEGPEGVAREKQLVDALERAGANLIGPNCIGVVSPHHASIFVKPTAQQIVGPSSASVKWSILSSSGGIAVFVMEKAIEIGVGFETVFSIGDAAMSSVPDVLDMLAEHAPVAAPTSKVLLLYMESVTHAERLYKAIRLLRKHGRHVVALKSGVSEVGSRAAASHTGAMVSPDDAVSALLTSAGAIRVSSRDDMVQVASVLSFPRLNGPNICVITHTGGSGVLLTDALTSKKIFKIPFFDPSDPSVTALRSKLLPCSCTNNPIDILAAGSTDHVEAALAFCLERDDVDGVVIVFGSPGIESVEPVYRRIRDMQRKYSKKPIYPLLPSLVNAEAERKWFFHDGGIAFDDEGQLSRALTLAYENAPWVQPAFVPRAVEHKSHVSSGSSLAAVQEVVTSSIKERGFLSPAAARSLLMAAGIPLVAEEVVCKDAETAVQHATRVGLPVVLKVVGPLHKSESGGVLLNVRTPEAIREGYATLMAIPSATGVLVQPMVVNKLPQELFIGAKRHIKDFGYTITIGLGGVALEMIQDTVTIRADDDVAGADEEAKKATRALRRNQLLRGLRSAKCMFGTQGFRGFASVAVDDVLDYVERIDALIAATKGSGEESGNNTDALVLTELDLNPILLTGEGRLVAVDARVAFEHPE